ncbi:hypothetical protein KEM56_005197 [Ascosphaera pollenicola]|nr:hypothetical protein KEM56_005197 [Ascosphaera pollenicola]
MGQNWVLLTVVGTALVLSVGFLLYKCYSRVVAINSCSALPWPFSKIAAAWRRPGTKDRDGYYFHLASSPDYDDAEFNSKLPDGDEYQHGHGRRRSLVAAAAHSQQQSYYNEKQDANTVTSMGYSLTPTHSNVSSSSTVISEAPAEHEPPHYASQDHLAPATATNAYPTHIERSPSSRLQLPTLSSFLPRKLGRSRESSPAARPHSSGDAGSGCGLTGEDVEAQTTLTRQLSYQGERSAPIDMRESWARDDARRQR